MRLGWYTGQFLPENAAWLGQALQQPSSTGYVNSLVQEAAALTRHRPASELHAIATHAESVIMCEAVRLAREQPESGSIDEVMWRAQATNGEAEDKRAAAMRRMRGDVDLWLGAGAERAAVGQDLSGLIATVSRSEFFAVIAVWKAADLAGITREVYRTIRTSWGYDKAPADTPREQVERLLDDPLFQGMALMHQIGHVSAEITRAATMALEAEYFEGALQQARAAGAAEREKALLDARDLHVREAGARGGATRAAKFEPAKRRAIELYSAPDAKYRSRTAAAEAIARVLEAEGLHSKFDFVHQTLKDHDRAIQAARAKKE